MTPKPGTMRIVLVAMVDSIHVARWVSQFADGPYEFSIFPSTPNRSIHPILTALAKTHPNVRIWPVKGRLSLFLWGLDLVFQNRIRAWLLARLISRVSPDFVHALEFQHGAYLAEQALRKINLTGKFIATNYGSDIFWFRQFPRHLERIKQVLARADFYSAECHRDVTLAREIGFSGVVLPVIPNAGGIDLQSLGHKLSEPQERKIVLVKGYDGWVGRARVAVAALELVADQLRDLEIVFYSCNRKTIRAARRLSKTARLKVSAYPKKALSHAGMLDLFSKSLIYVGLSLSDGISTSLVEALALGAFPVQTDTACTAEWFTNGEEGYEVSSLDPSEVAATILKAIEHARVRTDLHKVSTMTLLKAGAKEVSAVAASFYAT